MLYHSCGLIITDHHYSESKKEKPIPSLTIFVCGPVLKINTIYDVTGVTMFYFTVFWCFVHTKCG